MRFIGQIFKLALLLLTLFWLHPAVLIAAVALTFFSPPIEKGLFAAALAGVATHIARRRLGRLVRRPNSHGTARFATGKDISRAKLFKGKGLLLGRHKGRMMRYSGDGHLLTFAPTRSGKGVGCVIPNLLTYPGSVVVTDIKGENYALTHQHRQSLGAVYALAPMSDHAHKSYYNPLDFIRTGTAYELDDTRLIAEMLVVPDHTHANHWEREARTLITGILLYLLHHKQSEQHNLGMLRDILMQDEEELHLALTEMATSPHGSIARIASGTLQKETRERSAVISTAQGATEIFESPQLRTVTRVSSFKLEGLKDTTASLYIIIPPEYLDSYRPYLRLMIGLATVAMTRHQHKPEQPVLFLLDELPALGYMRPVEDGIGYLAGYGAKLWLFVQDLDQLQKTYPKARSIIANCAIRQAFNVQDPDTAKLLSEMLGQTTIPMHSKGQSSPLPFKLLKGSFQHGVFEGGRPLMTPAEVMSMPPHKQLIFTQNTPAIMARKIRYFDWWERRLRKHQRK